MSDEQLVKIKTNVSTGGIGAELEIHKDTATIIGKLFPGFSAKLQGRRIVASKVLQKLEASTPLNDEDLEYAGTILGDAELKWARKRAIAERAQQLLATDEFSARLLPAHEDPSARQEPAQDPKVDPDWAGRLFEDVGVVTDEVLSELYARILATGISQPNSCSKRTLGVLRDMDRRIADLFAKTLLVECGGAVPRDDTLLQAVNLTYSDVLELDAVGLLDSSATVSKQFKTDDPVFLTNNQRIILLAGAGGVNLPIYPLTRAAQELKGVADIASDDSLFEMLLNFLKQHGAGRPNLKIAHSLLPHIRWSGPVTQLVWKEVPTGTDQGRAG